MTNIPTGKPLGQKLITVLWPIIASSLAAAAFIVQLAMGYGSSSTSQQAEINHTVRALEKIDQRMEKIDSRVAALEGQLINNSAEFRVQIKGLQEEIAALRYDLRGIRTP